MPLSQVWGGDSVYPPSTSLAPSAFGDFVENADHDEAQTLMTLSFMPKTWCLSSFDAFLPSEQPQRLINYSLLGNSRLPLQSGAGPRQLRLHGSLSRGPTVPVVWGVPGTS